jgi:predicted permease
LGENVTRRLAQIFGELSRTIRYAGRSLRKAPRFAGGTIATLALCVGAALTIFAVVDGVLLRPLPFPNAADLVAISNSYPKAGVPDDGCSLPNYYERRGRLDALAGIAVYRRGTAVVGDPGATEREHVTWVSPDFFATVGLGPMIGRAFTEEETTYAASRVAIVTHAYWTERLNADPQVMGRRLRVDGGERTVVGVLPSSFSFLSSKARLYFPLASAPEERALSQRHSGSARMVARLARGRTADDAQAQIDAHNAAMRASDPEDAAMTAAGFRSIVAPLHGDHVKSVREVLLLLQIGVVILLLIGGANVANLFLIRSSSRLKELAVRRAIGAARRHIVTEIMAETMITAVAGAIAGLWIGSAGIAAVRALAADQLPLGARILFDGRVAIAGLAGSVILGVAIGVPLAWYHLKVPSAGALQSESRGGTTARGIRRLRHAFVVTQIAMAFVLLSGAGLLAISLRQVLEVSPGFRSADVISGQVTLPGSSYPDPAALVTFTERLAARLARQPGIVATGFVTNVPLSGISNRSAATVRGYAPAPGESPRGIYSYSVAGDYFAALGFTLREGRFLTGDDSRRRDRVCVVDEDFARRNWPGTTAIGKELFEGGQPGANTEAFRVVGVVRAVKQADVTEADALGAVYYPLGHRPDRSLFVVARTAAGAGSPGVVLRDSVRQLDAELPVNDIQSMDQRISGSLVTRRSPALLAAVFSAVALLLAAIGAYGVLGYTVAERRREIGLRIALGARPGQVRRQLLGTALRMLAAGGGIGLAGSWLAGRAMQTILYQVPAFHPPTLAVTALVIGGVSLLACLGPARRAARISPLEALAE